MSSLAPQSAGNDASLWYGGYITKNGAIAQNGVVRRVLARILDTVFHFIILMFSSALFIIVVLAAALTDQSAQAMLQRAAEFTPSTYILSFTGFIIYHALCEGLHGSSLGKLMLGLAVVREDGRPCTLRPALVRSVMYFMDMLYVAGLAAMQKSPLQQREGDVLAHTIVCRRSMLPPQATRGAGRFVAVLLLACMADACCIAFSLLLKVL